MGLRQLAQFLVAARTVLAETIYIKRVVRDLELVLLSRPLNETGNLSILNLRDRATSQANEVIMRLSVIGSLILRLILSELVFEDESALKEQVDGIIKRRAADTVVLLLHKGVEFLYVKMSLTAIYLIENCEALRCLAMSLRFQIFGKQFLYGLSDRLLFHVVPLREHRLDLIKIEIFIHTTQEKEIFFF